VYMPRISSATPLRRYRLGTCRAVLLGDIESVGAVAYLYIMAVVADGAPEPLLYVASEVNALADAAGGSHFLGVFDERGHGNGGASNEWADLDLFAQKALSIALERLDLSELPEQLV